MIKQNLKAKAFSEVIVVEGKNDERRLKEIYPEIETINTNGSEISTETIAVLKELSKIRELVLFFDPDYPGQRIRSLIMKEIPNCKHAFIRREDGISKNHRKIGVEHASTEVIVRALNNVLSITTLDKKITINDLFRLGILGNKQLRIRVAEKLKIGYANGKTMLKRLNMFGISLKELEEAVALENW